MADLIDRRTAIDTLDVLCQEHRYKIPGKRETYSQYNEAWQDALDRAEGAIFNLPSAQPEQRWIPCSERLPDRFGKMLVTFIPAAGTLWTRVIIANYSDLMGIAKPCFWIGNVGKSDFANITSRVVAWMPLPEPYQEEKHE